MVNLSVANAVIASSLCMLMACQNPENLNSHSTPNSINWKTRQLTLPDTSKLLAGSTYLSVYSQIYAQSEHRTFPLTATVSMRNISSTDTLFLTNASYYNTQGQKLRNYFNQAIYIAPLETLEIVIKEGDTEGGSGANFLFDWYTYPQAAEPHFEAVMISTSGQQGLSFTTIGIKK